MRASSAIICSGETSSGLMSISLIQRCSIDEQAEADEKLLERGEIDRLLAAHALERLVNPGLLHHASRERGVERRQAEGAILEDFHVMAAGAEEQHRTKLRRRRCCPGSVRIPRA